jgi:hypothetical protein
MKTKLRWASEIWFEGNGLMNREAQGAFLGVDKNMSFD